MFQKSIPSQTKKTGFLARLFRRGSSQSKKQQTCTNVRPIPEEMLVKSLLPAPHATWPVPHSNRPGSVMCPSHTSNSTRFPLAFVPSHDPSYLTSSIVTSSGNHNAYAVAADSASVSSYASDDDSEFGTTVSTYYQSSAHAEATQFFQATYTSQNNQTCVASPSTIYQSPVLTHYPENTAQMVTYVQNNNQRRSTYTTLGSITNSYTDNSVHISSNNSIIVHKHQRTM